MIGTYLKPLLLPPLSLFLLAALGWLVRRRWPRLGAGMLVAAPVLLFVLSTPMCSRLLLLGLEFQPPLTSVDLEPDAGAIVVLSGDTRREAGEYGGDTVGRVTLERVRYGARLHRVTGGLPVLTTGGSWRRVSPPTAEVMAAALREDFDVHVRWVEPRALNTWGNATFTAAMLLPEGIGKIYLVTTASHMPRATACFEAAGFDVIPAPTGASSPVMPGLGALIPSARSLDDSAMALHEYVGRVWYATVHY